MEAIRAARKAQLVRHHSRHSITNVGTSNTRIDDGLKVAVDAAAAAPSKPHLVLISDGKWAHRHLMKIRDTSQRLKSLNRTSKAVLPSRWSIQVRPALRAGLSAWSSSSGRQETTHSSTVTAS